MTFIYVHLVLVVFDSGILTQEVTGKLSKIAKGQYVLSSYVNVLLSAGAKVVPILYPCSNIILQFLLPTPPTNTLFDMFRYNLFGGRWEEGHFKKDPQVGIMNDCSVSENSWFIPDEWKSN